MTSKAFAEMGVAELQRGLAAKEFSAREVAEGSLARISLADPKVHAFLEVTEELALKAADRVDAAVAAGIFKIPTKTRLLLYFHIIRYI